MHIFDKNKQKYMKRCKIIVFFVCLTALPLSAQRVTNIHAQQEGREIAVYYDLSARANVTLKVTVDGKNIKPQLVSGDLGKNTEAGEQKRIAWQVLDEKDGKFNAQNVVFSIHANAPWRAFVLAQGGISPKPFQYSAGLMAGVVSRAGVYVKATSSFQFASIYGNIARNEDGLYVSPLGTTLTDAEMPYYLSGKTKPMHWLVDAGAIVRLADFSKTMWYIYAGGGYGVRQQLWQAYDGQWLNYMPTTYKGWSLDAGCMMAYKHLAVSLGATTIAFKYAEIQVGIGYVFN